MLAAGIAIRLLWLCLGLARLRRYRVSAIQLETGEDCFDDMRRAIAPAAEILVSGRVTSPVTFGFWNPVVLLPDGFRGLPHQEQRSIVCHELIHIQRRDWAVAVGEELIRCILWFHPAIWWLLGQIQLTREQVVDEAVIDYTGDRTRYLDALLAIASQRLSADLAPAPLFLKKHHLRQRVESIVSGVTMTKRNLLLPLAAAFATLPILIGIAAWQFPLRAAPQEAVDDPGVEVQLGAATILHRTGIAFPDEARAKHLSGTVVVGVTVNDKGEVTDAAAVSGPQELRKPVVQSVLNWHFSPEANQGPNFQLAVRFDGGRAAAPSESDSNLVPTSASDEPRTVDAINLNLLPAALRAKVEQANVVRVGDVLTRENFKTVEASLRNIDDHLRMTGALHGDKVSVMIRIASPPQVARVAPVFTSSSVNVSTPQSIRVGGNVQSANLIRQVKPKYPVDAKQARIQGIVRFNATIGPDGAIQSLDVVEGHPMLVTAAMDAVKQWLYKPTLLNGNPVTVMTVIDVNFTLLQ